MTEYIGINPGELGVATSQIFLYLLRRVHLNRQRISADIRLPQFMLLL